MEIKQKIQPWLICFSAALFFFYEYVQMNVFNAISSNLMQAFSMDSAEFGVLASYYLYADTLFLLPAGLIIDRFSTRKIILLSLSICVLGTFFFAIAKNLLIAKICRFSVGIGNAFSFLTCTQLAARWFPPRRLALVIGFMVTIATLGGVASQTPLAVLVEKVGWRHALVIDALIGVLILVVIWLFVRDKPYNQETVLRPQVLHFLDSIKLACRNLQNWLGGIYTCLLCLPVFLFTALWGNLYLSQAHHLSNINASYVITMIFIGMIIGSPLVGWFSDYIRRRRLPMILGAIASFLISLPIVYFSTLSFIQLTILFFLLGFASSSQIVTYPLIAESNPKNISSTAMGLMSTLVMGGGASFQIVVSWLLGWLGKSVIVSGVPSYSVAEFRFAFTLLPLAFVVSLIAALLIRETYCKAVD